MAALLELPDGLRPDRHSLGEDERGRPIGDVDEYLNSLSSDPVPPLLRGRGVDYDISAPDPKPLVCRCELHAPPRLVETFMRHMAAANPLFGYACTWEELVHRNRVVAEVHIGTSVGKAESWVGRDTSRYVPGLYWTTMLSDALAARHGVPLAEIGKAAPDHSRPTRGQHLFRFHDLPEDWTERRQALDDLCASLPGVFSIAEVKPAIAGVTDHQEHFSILRRWP